MKKVVLNGCYGGFGLSALAIVETLKRKGKTPYVFKDKWGKEVVYDNPEMDKNGYYSSYEFDREDADLVAVVEELGEKANDKYANLYIEEYDDENFIYLIDEYDGVENLQLIPVVTETRLEKCKSTKEIIEYLQSLDIIVQRKGA